MIDLALLSTTSPDLETFEYNFVIVKFFKIISDIMIKSLITILISLSCELCAYDMDEVWKIPDQIIIGYFFVFLVRSYILYFDMIHFIITRCPKILRILI